MSPLVMPILVAWAIIEIMLLAVTSAALSGLTVPGSGPWWAYITGPLFLFGLAIPLILMGLFIGWIGISGLLELTK